MIAIVFDTETTGLPFHPAADIDKQPRIIEFGAVLMRGDDIIERYSTLINPGVPITEEITKITGLTDEDVSDVPTFDEVLPQIQLLFDKADAVIAHNLPFDMALVTLDADRYQAIINWPRHKMCTVQLYAEEWGRRPKLLELYERILGRPLAQTHRALDDVMALAEIIQHEHLLELF